MKIAVWSKFAAARRALLMFACLVPALAFAADPANIDEAIAAIEKASANTKSWKGQMEIEMSMMGMQIKQSGPVTQMGSQKAAELTMDVAGQKITMKNVIDKSGTVWIETNAMGAPMVMKMDGKTLEAMGAAGGSPMGGMGAQMNDDPTALLKRMNEMAKLEWKGVEKSPDGDLYVLEGDLGPEFLEGMAAAEQMGVKLDLKRARLAFGKADGFPREFILLDSMGKPLVSTRYKAIEFNPQIDEKIFAYAPPPGAQVQDLMEMAKQMGAGGDAGALLGESPAAAAPSPKAGFNSKLQVGAAAPEFEAKAWKSGESVSSAALRGKPAVLHFWASWRKPSAAQIGEVAALVKDLGPKGLRVIGVSLDRADAPFEEFMGAHPEITWPIVYDGKGWNNAVAKLYGVDDIPFMLLVGADGKVAARAEHVEDIRSAAEELLAK